MLILIVSGHKLSAQSYHYWSQNFNTESSLLAGAVVGGNAGPSAVYYNPALINQNQSNKFALSANLVSFQSMNIENLAGSGTEYSKLVSQVQPGFVSIAGAPKKNPKFTYEFAFMVPLTNDIQFGYYYNDELDIIKRLDGNEDYTGEIEYKNKYDDYYVGGGISYIISDNFTIGASLFLSNKVLKYRSTLAMKAMQDNDTIYSQGEPEPFYFAQSTFAEQMQYSDYSLILKLGAHYNSPNGNWGLGLNITMPNLSLFGSGDVKKEYYRSNVFNDSTGLFTADQAFLSLQEEVNTKIKDPFSVAIGFQYNIPNRKNSIVFTAQYFLSIDEYAMLETTDSKVIGNLYVENVAEVMTYYTSADPVLNLGFGFIQYINEKLTLNGGFKTNFNTLTGQEQRVSENITNEPMISNIYFDKFHLIAGPSVSVKKFGFVLGIQYTWAREKNLYNMANFIEPDEYDPVTNLSLIGERANNMSINYNEISFFFGLSYGFGQ